MVCCIAASHRFLVRRKMSSNNNDLNHFDLGLPSFEATVSSAPSEATNAVPVESSSSKPVLNASSVSQTPSASSAASVPIDQLLVEASESKESNLRKSLLSGVPSWLISTAIHVGALLILGAWNIEPIQKELKMLLVASESSGESEALEEFSIDEAMAAELVATETDESVAEAPVVDANLEDTKVDMNFADMVSANMPAVSMPSVTQSLVPKKGLASQANAAMLAAMNGRSKEVKRDLLSKYGGSTDTEKAVSQALKWLALHQDKSTGGWTLSHSLICNGQCDHPGKKRFSVNAATGLALMCFLGAGQTHLEGEYKTTVFNGLSFLIKNMKFDKAAGINAWYVGGEVNGIPMDDMYGHGIASIALCEAFGMTRDPALFDAAQAGVTFLTYAQNPSTGGWHYGPKGLGDTSVVGWQMMALKSGAMSGLSVDLDVVRRANVFLDQMSWGPNNGFYHYSHDSVRQKAGYNPSTTACAVLCRMYSGVSKEHPSIKSAIEQFDKDGPSPSNTYYNYYATQVMKQAGGAAWEKWNVLMRDKLLASQTTSGHAAGSWYWDDGHSTESGGRFYTTCMATMMLEVYYRYLPIYSEQTEEDTFKL